MRSPKNWIAAAAIVLVQPVLAQPSPMPPASAPAQSAPIDLILTAAEDLVGRALFLRGFYAPNSLTYSPEGAVEGDPKSTGWTLAGVNILKASRPTPDSLELDGVRAAIRYNPDAHEFQRHPLNDEKIKLLLKLPPNPTPAQLDQLFAAIFAIGIDPALQRSMPAPWRHYFDPSLPWTVPSASAPSGQPPGPLAGQTIYPITPLPPLPNQPSDIVPPILTHQAGPQITPAARHDRVFGTVQLRIAIDPEGVPQRIAIVRPLGYGLDEQAVEAVSRWRFNPALHAGQPVASTILVNLDFQNTPRR